MLFGDTKRFIIACTLSPTIWTALKLRNHCLVACQRPGRMQYITSDVKGNIAVLQVVQRVLWSEPRMLQAHHAYPWKAVEDDTTTYLQLFTWAFLEDTEAPRTALEEQHGHAEMPQSNVQE